MNPIIQEKNRAGLTKTGWSPGESFPSAALSCVGSNGYMTQFFAKDPDPAIGLDMNNISQNLNSVTGPDYYRNVMGKAIPVTLSPAVGALLFE